MIPGDPLTNAELLEAARGERALIISAVRAAGVLGCRAGRFAGPAINPFDPEIEDRQHHEWQASFEISRQKQQVAAKSESERRSPGITLRLPYRDD